MINIIPLPAFKDNYIWTLHNSQHTVVIDPGDAAPVRAWLNSHHLNLAAILCTHHHNDHTGGIGELVEVYNVPVYGPQNECISCISDKVSEGFIVKINELNLNLKVLDIPGHTSGHIAYLTQEPTEKAQNLFCGDTLFGCGCGRIFEGTAAQMYQSLNKIAQLADDTKIYCAHEYTEANIRFALACEPNNAQIKQRETDTHLLRANGHATIPSTLALEKATNPFLRCNSSEIIRTLQEHGLPHNDELAVFTALREWKNHF